MKIWVFLNGMQQGPYTEFQISELPITEETPVWYEGLPQWTAAGIAPATAHLFSVPTRQTETSTADVTEPVTQGTAQETEAQQPRQQQYIWQARTAPDEPCPPTFLAWAIILTICCCSPTSIAAIVTSIFVSKRYNRGDINGARRMSEATEWLIIISIVLGLVLAPFSWSAALS